MPFIYPFTLYILYFISCVHPLGLQTGVGGWFGRQDGSENVSGNIFDRQEELKLRESMGYDGKKMADGVEL